MGRKRNRKRKHLYFQPASGLISYIQFTGFKLAGNLNESAATILYDQFLCLGMNLPG